MADLARLKRNIIESMEKLTTLETVTVVGGIEHDAQAGWHWSRTQKAELVGMLTKKSLLGGDITTVIHPDLLADARDNLRAFHLEREKAGDQIIENNIAAVRALFDLVNDLINREQVDTGAAKAPPGSGK